MSGPASDRLVAGLNLASLAPESRSHNVVPSFGSTSVLWKLLYFKIIPFGPQMRQMEIIVMLMTYIADEKVGIIN